MVGRAGTSGTVLGVVDTPEPPLPDVAGVDAHKAEQRDAIDSLLDVMNAEKRWKAERFTGRLCRIPPDLPECRREVRASTRRHRRPH